MSSPVKAVDVSTPTKGVDTASPAKGVNVSTPTKKASTSSPAKSAVTSSPNKATDNTLTPREVELMAKLWKCLKSPPEIDIPKLAQECGMTNVGSASNAWGRIKKKLFADSNAATGSSATTETPPVTPSRKRKKLITTVPVGEDGAVDGKDAGDGTAAATGTPGTPVGTTPVPGETSGGGILIDNASTPMWRRRGPLATGSPKPRGGKRGPRTPKKSPVKVEDSDTDVEMPLVAMAAAVGEHTKPTDGAV